MQMSHDVTPSVPPINTFTELAIVTAPHPALDTPSEPVGVVDASVRLLAARMVELMHRGVPDGGGRGGITRGIGLAANQVNVMKRLIVVDIPGKKAVRDICPLVVTRGPLVMINPEIELLGDATPVTERCLSLPGEQHTVRRWPQVQMTFTTTRGNRDAVFAGGLLAQCLQHLCDLLDGITIAERARLDARPEAVNTEAGAA